MNMPKNLNIFGLNFSCLLILTLYEQPTSIIRRRLANSGFDVKRLMIFIKKSTLFAIASGVSSKRLIRSSRAAGARFIRVTRFSLLKRRIIFSDFQNMAVDY